MASPSEIRAAILDDASTRDSLRDYAIGYRADMDWIAVKLSVCVEMSITDSELFAQLCAEHDELSDQWAELVSFLGL